MAQSRRNESQRQTGAAPERAFEGGRAGWRTTTTHRSTGLQPLDRLGNALFGAFQIMALFVICRLSEGMAPESLKVIPHGSPRRVTYSLCYTAGRSLTDFAAPPAGAPDDPRARSSCHSG